MSISKTALATVGLLGGAWMLSAQPAAAASFRCSASVSVNDAGPQTDLSQAAPCGLQFASPNGAGSAATSATAGVLRAGTHAEAFTPSFVGTNAYAEAFDQVQVSGLGDAGATLTFKVQVDGHLIGAVSGGRTLGGDPTGASNFFSRLALSTDGRGANDSLSGCVTPFPSGISVCNGTFDYGPSLEEDIDDVMTASIFLMNGDVLNIFMSLQASSLARTVDAIQSGSSTANFGHTVYWDGLVFDEASKGVKLTSAATGFDYRLSAFPPTMTGVPEPATWAVMILGFGLAGAVLRRRAAIVA